MPGVHVSLAVFDLASNCTEGGIEEVTMDLATRANGGAIMERVLIEGDLARLKPEERVTYYQRVCESLGLNPLTKPFNYINLNGRLVLYPLKDCTDQLRTTRSVSITKLEREVVGDLYIVTAYATDSTGRSDSDVGAVSIANLKGESLANAILKAVTKAKRRVTLSLCGLGWTDESEIDSIPSARTVVVDHGTGEVQAVEPDRDAAMAEWVLATEEATQLGIEHKQLPDNADTAKIERWTAALHDKIYATREANGGTISSH